MSDILIGVWVICALVVVCGIWMLICNEITYRQRMKLIKNRPDGIEFWAFAKEFDAVSYDDHMRALATFSSPRTLYGSLTQRIWK